MNKKPLLAPSFQCIKTNHLFILLYLLGFLWQINLNGNNLFPILPDSAESCFNLNAEEGTYENWSGLVGHVDESNGNTIVDNVGFDLYQHTVTDPGWDPIGLTCGLNIPTVFQGNHSIRLGDNNGGFEVSWIRREIEVTEETSILLLHYAVILENPDHEPWEQPRFALNLLDENNNVLPCGEYSVTADDNIPGFQECGSWQVRDWSSDAIILTPYIGQTVILEFMAADCAQGAHAGYAYMEAECVPVAFLAQDFCPGEDITLEIPDLFASYEWSTGDTTNSIYVEDAEAGASYNLEVTSITGCTAELTFSVPNPPVLSDTGIEASPDYICAGDSVSLSVSGQNIASVYWPQLDSYDNPLAISPSSTTIYDCIISDQAGCITINESITIEVSLPDELVIIQADTSICEGETITLEALYSGSKPLVWDPIGVISNNIVVTPNVTTVYSLNAIDSTSCAPIETSITVEVIPLSVIDYEVNEPSVCPGESVSLTLTSPNQNLIESVVWGPSGASGPSITVTPDTTQFFDFTINDVTGCVQIDDQALVSVNAVNELYFLEDELSVCLGEPVQVDVFYDGSAPLAWQGIADMGSSFSFIPENSMTIIVSSTDNSLCAPLPDTLNITVIGELIEYSIQDAYLCLKDDSVQLSISSQDFAIIENIEWPQLGVTGSTINAAPTSSQFYDFVIYDTAGCFVIEDSVYVEVEEVADLYFIQEDFSICLGETAQVDLFYNGTSPLVWEGVTDMGNSFTLSPQNSMSIIVNNTDNSYCSPYPDTLNITVIGELIDYSIQDEYLCLKDDSVQLVISSPDFDIIESIEWPQLGVTGSTINVAPNSSQFYDFVIYDTAGCFVIEDSVYVEVEPIADLYFIQNDLVICEGETVQIDLFYNGTDSLIWQGVTDMGNSFSLTPDNSVSIIVNTLDNSYCTPNPDTLNITVLAATTNYQIQDVTFCPNDEFTMTVTGQNLGVVYWSSLGVTAESVTVSPTASTSYPISITDANNCYTTLDTIFTTLANQLSLDIFTENDTICQGDSVTLNTTYNGSGDLFWPNINQTGLSVTFIPQTSGYYVAEAVENSSCPLPADSIYLTVLNVPPMIYQTPDFSICNGDSIVIDIAAQNVGQVFWPQLNIGETVFSFSSEIDTVLYVELTDLEFCRTITDSVVISITADDELFINEPDSTICIGETIQLSAFYNGNATIEWSETNSQNLTTEVTPDTTTTYYLYALDQSNCAPTTDSITITVLDAPEVIIELDDEKIICLGDSADLSVMGANFGTVYWPHLDTIAQTITVSPDSTATYLVLINDLFDCKTILDSFVVNVNVTYPPIVSPERGDTLICEGDTAILSITGQNVATVFWPNLNFTSPILEVSPQENTWYHFQVWDSLDCEIIMDSVLVQVKSLPEVEILQPEPTICEFDTLFITATGSADIDTFEWISQNVFGPTLELVPDTTATLFLQATDIFGCKSEVLDYSIFVLIPPDMSYSIIPEEVCFGDTLLVNIEGEFIGGTYWPSEDTLAAEIELVGNNSTNIAVSIIDIYGCDTIAEQVPIEVLPLPEVVLAAAEITICEEQSVSLTVLNDSESNDINWIGLGENSSSISFVATVSDTIEVTVTDANNCLSVPKSAFIDVNPLPELSVAEASYVACFGENFELVLLIDGEAEVAQIFLDNEAIGNDATIDFILTDSEIADIKVEDGNGCVSDEIAVPIEVLSVPTLELGPDLCEQGEITLNATYPGATYLWQDGSTNPTLTVEYSDFYSVEIENVCGKVFDDVNILIDGCRFKMSTGFTPNGDGQNDFFGPIDVCQNDSYKDMTFRVFNRWGQKIFEETTIDKGWDGSFKDKISDQGVYVWELTYYSEICERWYYEKGNVTLVR